MRRFAMFILFLGALPAAGQHKHCSDYFMRAMGFKLAGNTDSAQTFFQKSVACDARNDAAWYELALITLDKKEYSRSLGYIHAALLLKPREIWYLNVLATLYSRTEDNLSLTKVYRKMERYEPNEVNYYLGEAAAWWDAGKFWESMKSYDRAEKITGSSDEIALLREKGYIKLGDTLRAIAGMGRLIEESPQNLRYRLLMADVYRTFGQEEKMITALQRAVEIDSLNGYAELALADLYRTKGDLGRSFGAIKKAFYSEDVPLEQKKLLLKDNYLTNPSTRAEALTLVRILEKVYPEDLDLKQIHQGLIAAVSENSYEERRELVEYLSKNKLDLNLWVDLILTDFNLRNFSGAAQNAIDATAYFPSEINFYWYAGLASIQAEKPAMAVVYLNKGLALANHDLKAEANLYRVLGDAYRAADKMKLSDWAYEEALRRLPQDVETLNSYSYSLSVRKRNLKKAEVLISKAVAAEPDNSNLEDTYAWVLFNKGRYQDAEEWMMKALKHGEGTSGMLFDHYGDILQKLGRLSEAVRNWKKARTSGTNNLNLVKKIEKFKFYE